MYTNADCTLYLYSEDGFYPAKERYPSESLYMGTPSGCNHYLRVPIYGVYWEDVRQSSFYKTGQKNAVTALVVIPRESLDTPIDFTQGKDLIVKGIVDYEIDCTDQATLAHSLEALKKAYDYLTAVMIDERLYGSESVQHYELSCK